MLICLNFLQARLQEEEEVDNAMRTVYILAAVIAVLVITVIIIIYVSMVTRSKYQRKLQAVTVRADGNGTI